jgi:TPR repeat protein
MIQFAVSENEKRLCHALFVQADIILSQENADSAATAEALVLLNRAVSLNSAASAYRLYEYYRSIGDDLGALKFLRKAAEMGVTDACFQMGLLLVENEDSSYERWLLRAMEQGDRRAMTLLGGAYVSGQGGIQKPEEGRSLLEKAVGLGCEQARKLLDSTAGGKPSSPSC